MRTPNCWDSIRTRHVMVWPFSAAAAVACFTALSVLRQGTNTDMPTPHASQSMTIRTSSGYRSYSRIASVRIYDIIQCKVKRIHIDRRHLHAGALGQTYLHVLAFMLIEQTLEQRDRV